MMFQTFPGKLVLGRHGAKVINYIRPKSLYLTGISLRQLQWWDERHIVVPARDGHRRVYSLDDLAEVAIICELRRRGFSLQKIRRVSFDTFCRSELGKRLLRPVSAASEYHLLTDGHDIYLRGFGPRRGQPAEKHQPADVIRVPERYHPTGARGVWVGRRKQRNASVGHLKRLRSKAS